MSEETSQPRRRRSIQQQLAALATRIDQEKRVLVDLESKVREQNIRIMTMEDLARDFAAVDGLVRLGPFDDGWNLTLHLDERRVECRLGVVREDAFLHRDQTLELRHVHGGVPC